MTASPRKPAVRAKPDPVPTPEELVPWVEEVFDALERLHGIETKSCPQQANTPDQAPPEPAVHKPTQLPLL